MGGWVCHGLIGISVTARPCDGPTLARAVFMRPLVLEAAACGVACEVRGVDGAGPFALGMPGDMNPFIIA